MKLQQHLLFPLALVMYEITMYLSNDMYLSALPVMITDLNLSAADAQLTITMWFLGSALTPLVMGALADRFGRRPTLLVGGFFYIISTILCALAVNKATLLPPRFVEGAMVSSMMVAGYACIHEMYDHKEAIRILAIMGSISILAPALGPLCGALVLLVASWRAIFWIIAVLSTLTIFYLYFKMPETLQPEKRQSLHLQTLFKHYWRVVNNKTFIVLMLILGFIFGGFIAWITSGPLLVIDTLHYSEISYGLMQAVVFFAFIVGNYLVNLLLETHDAYRLIHFGLLATFIGGALMIPAAKFTQLPFTLFLIAMIFYSFGTAMCFAPLNRLIIESSDEPMGIRVAMFTVGFTTFGVIGSTAASFYFDGSAWSLGILISGAAFAACAFYPAIHASRHTSH